MKLVFLLFVFFLILTVHAQREITQYTCLVTHEHETTPFYLSVGAKRRVEVAGQKVDASLQRKGSNVELGLSRTILFADNSNSRSEKREFPMNSRKLVVELRHLVNGEEAYFALECSPRDP